MANQIVQFKDEYSNNIFPKEPGIFQSITLTDTDFSPRNLIVLIRGQIGIVSANIRPLSASVLPLNTEVTLGTIQAGWRPNANMMYLCPNQDMSDIYLIQIKTTGEITIMATKTGGKTTFIRGAFPYVITVE